MVTIAAFVALLTGIVATLVSRRILRRWPATLVPVVAAAYMFVPVFQKGVQDLASDVSTILDSGKIGANGQSR